MKKTLILTTLFIMLLTLNSYACSCYKKSIEDNFKGADLVFKGKVIDIIRYKIIDSVQTKNKNQLFKIKKYNSVEYKFKIQKLYKGKTSSQYISIYTSGGSSSCGNYFRLNSKQLIYSFIRDVRIGDFSIEKKIEPFLYTSSCSQTKEFKRVTRREKKQIKSLLKQL